MQGRWSLTAPLFENAPPAGPRLRAQAELMLERYGIVTRETVLAEGVPGGFASLYGELSNLEMLGTARRGYFVEGLGGAQFALAGAVERLRALPDADGRYLVLAATDPGQPVRRRRAVAEARRRGQGGRRPSRTPGRLRAAPRRRAAPLRRARRPGHPAPASSSRARRWPRRSASSRGAAREGLIPRLAIERLDGEPVIGSGLEDDADRGRLLAASRGAWSPPPEPRCDPALERGIIGRREGGRMSATDPVELLSRVPLFSELSADELERISRGRRSRAPSRRACASSTRATTRTPATSSAQGDLRVTREHSDGRAIALATLGPGDIFGELAMLDGEARSASVETLSDSRAAGAARGGLAPPARRAPARSP